MPKATQIVPQYLTLSSYRRASPAACGMVATSSIPHSGRVCHGRLPVATYAGARDAVCGERFGKSRLGRRVRPTDHFGVDEPLGLLDQQAGCRDKLGFGKQRFEFTHGMHRSAAPRPIALQPEPAVGLTRYQRGLASSPPRGSRTDQGHARGLSRLLRSRVTTPGRGPPSI